jgi:hypothetical protein
LAGAADFFAGAAFSGLEAFAGAEDLRMGAGAGTGFNGRAGDFWMGWGLERGVFFAAGAGFLATAGLGAGLVLADWGAAFLGAPGAEEAFFAAGVAAFFRGGTDFFRGGGEDFFGFAGAEDLAFLGDFAGTDLTMGLGGFLPETAVFPLFPIDFGEGDFAATGFFFFDVMDASVLAYKKS